MMSTPPTEDFPDLEVLWCEEDPSSLRCYTCSNPLGADTLIRTFRLGQNHNREGSKVISTSLGEDIIKYRSSFGLDD